MDKCYLRRWHEGLNCWVYLYNDNGLLVEYSDVARLKTAFNREFCQMQPDYTPIEVGLRDEDYQTQSRKDHHGSI